MKLTARTVLVIAFAGLVSAQGFDDPVPSHSLSGWKSKAELDALVGKLRSGALKGEQPLFRAEDGPYRVYTSFIDNRKGIADIHEKDDEVFVVLSGSAHSTLGGTLADPTRRSAHELRATTITGGETRRVGVGDIISAPRGTPHQMDATGGHILYVVIKIIGEPAS